MRNQDTNRIASLRLVKKKETASPVRERQRIQAGQAEMDQSNTLASKLALPSRQLRLVVSTGNQQERLKELRQQILQKTYYVRAQEVAKGILRRGIIHVFTPKHASIFSPSYVAQPSALDSRFHENNSLFAVIPAQAGSQVYRTRRSFASGSRQTAS